MKKYRGSHTTITLALLLILSGAGGVAHASEPAKLNIDQIIKGIEDTQELWRAQKGWIIKYTHTRERIDPPPGKMVEFPDVELTNARLDNMLSVSYRQPLVGASGFNEKWFVWDGKRYTERDGARAYIQDTISPNILSYLWFPMSLMRNPIPEFHLIPEEAFQHDRELSQMLPYCLEANKTEYRVRPEMEEIDGVKCHVLERTGKDIMWISAELGFSVFRRTLIQPSGDLLTEFKASGFREYSKGIWLPKRQIAVAYNNDFDPPEYRRKVRFIMVNNLREAKLGDAPKSAFHVPLPASVPVEDRRKASVRQ